MKEVLTYKTLKESSKGLYKDKGSKFIAYAFTLETVDEIKAALTEVKSAEHSARHFCYAYRLSPDGQEYRANDDGEPSHSAGDPILGQIDSFNLTNTFIVVVRYFGGTKLGVGGLINAYRSAAKEAILLNTIVTKKVYKFFKLSFEYETLNVVMRYIKEYSADIVDQDMGLSCIMNVKLSAENAPKFSDKISGTRKVKIS